MYFVRNGIRARQILHDNYSNWKYFVRNGTAQQLF